MFEDMLLVLIAIVGAVGTKLADDQHLPVMVILCVLIYTASVFWMGVRSCQNK
jgi:hypothetical protein